MVDHHAADPGSMVADQGARDSDPLDPVHRAAPSPVLTGRNFTGIFQGGDACFIYAAADADERRGILYDT